VRTTTALEDRVARNQCTAEWQRYTFQSRRSRSERNIPGTTWCPSFWCFHAGNLLGWKLLTHSI